MKKLTIGIIILLALSIVVGTFWKGNKYRSGVENAKKAKDTCSFADEELSWGDIIMMDSVEKRGFYLALTDSLPNIWETRDVDALSYAEEDSIPTLPDSMIISLRYRQKVKGYSVKVDFVHTNSDQNYGQAILYFSKTDHSFKVYCDAFSDEQLISDDIINLKVGSHISLNYKSPEANEYLSAHSPFYFKDMDYDGEEELVINNLEMGSRGYNTYDVFKVFHVEKPLRLKGLPFTDGLNKINNYNVEYEPKSQSIIDKRYDGFDAYGYYRYKSIPSYRSQNLKKVFILEEAEDMGFFHPKDKQASDSVNLIQPYKRYKRENGKLVLIERGVYECGNYGQNYNEVVLEIVEK